MCILNRVGRQPGDDERRARNRNRGSVFVRDEVEPAVASDVVTKQRRGLGRQARAQRRMG